jgi:hypothetical protein
MQLYCVALYGIMTEYIYIYIYIIYIFMYYIYIYIFISVGKQGRERERLIVKWLGEYNSIGWCLHIPGGL